MTLITSPAKDNMVTLHPYKNEVNDLINQKRQFLNGLTNKATKNY